MRQLSLYEPLDSGPILEREQKIAGARAIFDLTESLIRLYGIILPKNNNKETA
jgi:hypothetical protein